MTPAEPRCRRGGFGRRDWHTQPASDVLPGLRATGDPAPEENKGTLSSFPSGSASSLQMGYRMFKLDAQFLLLPSPSLLLLFLLSLLRPRAL